MLCTISTSPYYSDLKALINLLSKYDVIVLLQDGVFIGHKLLSGNDNNYLISLEDKGIAVFAIRNDIEARGLAPYISSYVCQISYIDFVQLTIKHPQYLAW